MNTPLGHERNADQIAYWNGPNGERWVRRQEMQDVVLGPVSDILIDRAAPKVGERVIDVGCGCGATTFAFANKVGSRGHVLGVDISAPMLSLARALAPAGCAVGVRACRCDGAPFQPASFDLLVSRFGVMFFAEPAVSFANMRRRCAPPAAWRLPAGGRRAITPG